MAATALKDCTNDFAFEEDEEEAHQQRGRCAPDSAPKAAVTTKTGPEEGIVLDAHRLAQRQKQIDYGKNTLGYECYIKMVPREQRRCRKGGLSWIDPCTPDIDAAVSKRCFDGMVRVWRKALHKYDEIAQGSAAGPAAAAADGDAVNPPAPDTVCFKPDASSPKLAFPVPQPVPTPSSRPSARAAEAAQPAASSPQQSTGSKRYFKDAFKQAGGPAETSSGQPSPKKATLESHSPRHGRQRNMNNILDCILGNDSNASLGGDNVVSLGDGSGYLLADAGVSNDASFCGKLDRLDVQL